MPFLNPCICGGFDVGFIVVQFDNLLVICVKYWGTENYRLRTEKRETWNVKIATRKSRQIINQNLLITAAVTVQINFLLMAL